MNSIRNYAWRVMLVSILFICTHIDQLQSYPVKEFPKLPERSATSFDLGRIHTGAEPSQVSGVKPGLHTEQLDCTENSVNWSGTSNLLLSDNVYMSAELEEDQHSACLYISDFDLQIPAGASIQGVKFNIEGYIEGTDKPTEILIAMVDEQDQLISINYSGKVSKGKSWPQKNKEKLWKYGIIGEDWLSGVDADFLNSGNWSLKIQLKNKSDDVVKIFIDQIQMEVIYTPLYTLCKEDCGIVFIDPPGVDFSYEWFLPSELEITSEFHDHHIINFMMTNRDFGIKEICVEATSPTGEKQIVCRNILIQNCHPSKIGDFVWLDENLNGLQDAGEEGIPFISIHLMDTLHNMIASSSTDIEGYYLFTNIDSGHYYLQVEHNDHLIPTSLNSSTDPLVDNDLTIINEVLRTNTFLLATDQEILHLDMGFIPLTSIGDLVWLDLNADGLQDDAEKGVAGVTVELYNDSVFMTETVTDSTGVYLFEGLLEGNYQLCFNLPPGAQFSPYNAGDPAMDSDLNDQSCTNEFELLTGESRHDIDAGFYQFGSIGDQVWLDHNENGIQDTGEAGIENLQISLYDTASGLLVQTVTTDIEGKYVFNSIVPGTYFMILDNIDVYETSPFQTGSDANIDSDFQEIGDEFKSIDVLIQSGEHKNDVDAGLIYLKSSVGDFIWLDLNENGLQDADEHGLNGIEVSLHDESGDLIGNMVSANGPDGSKGFYQFDGLYPGNYFIRINNLPDLYLAAVHVSFEDELNSDITNGNGSLSTEIFNLAPNVIKSDIDIGFVYNYGKIGDRIWFDQNENGIQDPGETGQNDIQVGLLNSNGTLINTIITQDDPNSGEPGYYVFEDLLPESYKVQIIGLDPAFELTIPNNTSDEFDSDFVKTGNVILSHEFALSAGQYKLDVDAGIINKFGSIQGKTWMDLNENGLYENGENHLSGIPVFLFLSNGQFVKSLITDSEGSYKINEVPAGEYYVIFGIEPQYLFTVPNNGTEENDSDVTSFVTTGSTDLIILGNAEQLTHIDAGYIHNYGIIGDFVWLDVNANGLQDTGEQGINGINVSLYDKDHVLISTAITESINGMDGQYQFDNILTGQYYVQFELDSAYEFTLPNVGNDALDSDINGANGAGTTGLFTVAAGQKRLDIDGGFLGKDIIIGNYIWLDADQDGIQDNDESGINDLAIHLYNSDNELIQTSYSHHNTLTETDGFYEFIIQEEGNYYVVLELTSAYEPTLPNATDDFADSDLTGANGTGSSDLFLAQPGDIIDDLDFGLIYKTGSIGDHIWLDLDQNGLQDDNEIGIDDILIKLFNENDDLISTQQSFNNNGEAGHYQFVNVTPGNYYLEIILNETYIPTLPDAGDDELDSDLIEMNSRYVTEIFELQAGQNIKHIDLGLQFSLGEIQGLVWEDQNEDGIYENTEPGLEGITVELYDGDGLLLESDVTDTLGVYQFLAIDPGTYYLKFVVSSNYTFSTFHAGVNGEIDSDVDSQLGHGTTPLFELQPGEVKTDLFAGLIPVMLNSFVIGDRVWIDTDQNGLQDIDEAGLNGIDVELYDGDNVQVQTTVTGNHPVLNEAGYYSFSNVPAGIYHVKFDLPSGYAFTAAEQGSDDSVDSDVNLAFGPGTTSIFYFNGLADFLNVDAGLVAEQEDSYIGDLVWLDENKNGIQDPGESGVNDVKVILFDENSQEIRNTFTSYDPVSQKDGIYHFDNVPAGTYYLRFVIQAEYLISEADAGNDDFLDSDVTEMNGPGTTDMFYYVGGLDYINFDAGIYPDTYSSIGDFVWEDLNGNGLQELNEPGINEVSLSLYKQNGELVHTTQTTTDLITGAPGYYLFNGIPAGEYYIEVVLPNDFYLSEPFLGTDPEKDSNITHENGGYTSSTISLGVDDNDNSIDIGLYRLGQIGDLIWEDINSNGIQDSLEYGINEILIELYDTSQTLLASRYSDFYGSDTLPGYYLFEYLDPGQYYVKFNVDEDAEFSLFNVGNDTLDSDVTGAFGKGTTSIIELRSGENKITIDAGISFEGGYINGTVWIDVDGDGVWDASEEGMNEVLVSLMAEDGTKISEILSYSNSEIGTNGYYEFNNIPAGNYYLLFETPGSYTFSNAHAGTDDTLDSEVDHSFGFGTTDLIHIQNEQIADNIHAGIYLTATIGDFVWFDLNKNGLQDENEPGAPNIEVQLLANGFNLTETTYTDVNGYYSFSNLNQGIYAIKFITIPDYGFTIRNAGPDDSVDSDVGESGKSPLISLAHGAIFLDMDAGLASLSNMVGNLVFMDENQNELPDENEYGIAGSDIYLIDEDHQIAGFTRSDEFGNYQFYNLEEGTYQIKVVRPSLSGFQNRSFDNKEWEKEITTKPFFIGESDFITDLDIGFKMIFKDLPAESELTRMELYPNPFQRELNLKVAQGKADRFKILITDLSGKSYREFLSNDYGRFWVLELSDLPTGNYLIHLMEGDKLIEKKMVYKAEE